MNRQRPPRWRLLGFSIIKEGKVQTAEEHKPDYLRVSQAERERAERESYDGQRNAGGRPVPGNGNRNRAVWRRSLDEGRLFTFLTRSDALFLVVEERERILGYCGLLMVLDEGDITTLR